MVIKIVLLTIFHSESDTKKKAVINLDIQETLLQQKFCNSLTSNDDLIGQFL
jgi:hypothetical protein